MTIKDDLIRDEGLRLKPYYCTAQRLSIGYGRNLEDRGITKKEAEMMLENDIEDVFNNLDKALPNFEHYPLDIKRALTNMGFQLGIKRLLGFKKTLSLVDSGNYPQAAKEALNSEWARQTPARAIRVANLIKNAKGD
jgi:lysozyme